MTLEQVIRRNALNQRRVAAALGVTPETLSRWVRGHKRPTGENLVRLLGYLQKYEPKLQARDLVAKVVA